MENSIETIAQYLDSLTDPKQRQTMKAVLQWTRETYPALEPRIAWSSPHFTKDGTFIISYSASKDNLMVSPEYKALKHFGERFDKAGLKWSKMIVRFPWKKEIDYGLLQDIIDYNIKDKQGMTTYWRPKETWQ